jgi:glycosyltransferase involved in cell wall biosynthesis
LGERPDLGKNGLPVRIFMAKTPSRVSAAVVVTVFNEHSTIGILIDSLRNQTLTPSEVVIVDGGSTDDTYKTLLGLASHWKTLRVYQAPGNRSIGRNLAVSKTTSPLIAFTDAGCVPQKDWLEQLIAPFSQKQVEVVSGYYQGLYKNNFQKNLIPYVLVMPDVAGRVEFYPSTRSMAIRRSVWNKSGGFDIHLDHNEDYAFAIWLKKMGISFSFAPQAIVNWLPRKNLQQAAWMFLRFAVGDAQSGIIRPKVRLIFLRYLLFTYLIILSPGYPLLMLFIAFLALIYLIWSVQKNFRYVKNISALLWLPVLQITSDLTVIFGTIMGLLISKHGVF